MAEKQQQTDPMTVDGQYEMLTPEEVAALGAERGGGGGSALPLVRGSYTMRFPESIPDSCFKEATRKEYGPEGEPTGRILKYFDVQFADESALSVEEGPEGIGSAFRWRLSAVPRRRMLFGKRKEDNRMVVASDAQLLLTGAFKLPTPKGTAEMKAAIKRLANKLFKTRLVYAGSCNPKRDAWFAQEQEDGSYAYGPIVIAETEGEDGQVVQVFRKGCGGRLYDRAFTADPSAEDEGSRKGIYAICGALRADVLNEAGEKTVCGARVRGFAELEGFGPATA
jgi:hypothetical protein